MGINVPRNAELCHNGMRCMDRDWPGQVRGILRAEMARRKITYDDLVDKLGAIGVKETDSNLRKKLYRGTFTAIFFIQCLRAMGVTTLKLDDFE
jgi:hypothetical protein